MHLHCMLTGLRWWWGGTTATLALDAGFPASTSTPSRSAGNNGCRGNHPVPQSFEALNQRAVAVVVDPIQSVKGKVVIDAFRLINPQTMMLGQEPRQTTSNLGHLHKPSIQALIHGLNRHYYSISINYRCLLCML